MVETSLNRPKYSHRADAENQRRRDEGIRKPAAAELCSRKFAFYEVAGAVDPVVKAEGDAYQRAQRKADDDNEYITGAQCALYAYDSGCKAHDGHEGLCISFADPAAENASYQPANYYCDAVYYRAEHVTLPFFAL